MTLEIKELGFEYGRRRALEKVSLAASSGELICLLGENGAGKTTLFRCVLGLLGGYTGEILFDGRDARTLGTRETARRAAYIPQAASPGFNYRVGEVVLMGTNASLGEFETPSRAEEAAAASAIEAAGLSHLADRGYAELSGGERQLTLIARALAQRSPLLVMDEPTANLDYGNQLRLMRRIRALAAEGHTVLLSTHNPDHALRFADRVIVLKGGAVFGAGAPIDVLGGAALEAIYGVPARVHTVEAEGGRIPVCVPYDSDTEEI